CLVVRAVAIAEKCMPERAGREPSPEIPPSTNLLAPAGVPEDEALAPSQHRNRREHSLRHHRPPLPPHPRGAGRDDGAASVAAWQKGPPAAVSAAPSATGSTGRCATSSSATARSASARTAALPTTRPARATR